MKKRDFFVLNLFKLGYIFIIIACLNIFSQLYYITDMSAPYILPTVGEAVETVVLSTVLLSGGVILYFRQA